LDLIFIYSMVLHCDGTWKPELSLDQSGLNINFFDCLSNRSGFQKYLSEPKFNLPEKLCLNLLSTCMVCVITNAMEDEGFVSFLLKNILSHNFNKLSLFINSNECRSNQKLLLFLHDRSFI